MKIITPEEWKAREAAKNACRRTKCTKYQLVACLTAHFPELLQNLRTAYAQNTDLQFYWNTVNELDRNNEEFQAALKTLGITEALADGIFAKIGEPEAAE